MSSGASTSDPTARALAAAKAAFARVRAQVAAMSRPAKVLVVSTLVAGALILGWLGYKSQETTWAVLFTNLDREDAAAVVAKLKEMKVPYKLEGDGGTIEVPTSAARELRLELAGAGLPRGGGIGFESFDKMRLGATEFEQRVLFRRSLEGELARTMDTIAAVQSARVHLVLPERSVFVGRSEPASASVVLKLRPGRALGAPEVAGIVHLVASSVAGLTPDHVAVVTTEGTMLHRPRRPGEAEGLGGGDEEQSSAARSLEGTLEERARSMLEKVVGAGHVDVRVTAELDRARVEHVEDHYDPRSATIRSEQRSFERSSADSSPAGVPGAESNLPNGTGRGGGDAGTDGITRESTTRNFEVDHVSDKRFVTSGTLRRLTVAVVVDGTPAAGGAPRSREEVDRLAALVRSAVGADPARGDMVTVESVPFLAVAPASDAPAATPSIVPKRFEKYVPFVIGGAALLVGLVVLVAAARALRRRKKGAPTASPPELPAPSEVTALLAEPATPEPDPAAKTLPPEELRALAHDRAAHDPATAALVLRFWLGGEAKTDSDVTVSEGIALAEE